MMNKQNQKQKLTVWEEHETAQTLYLQHNHNGSPQNLPSANWETAVEAKMPTQLKGQFCDQL